MMNVPTHFYDFEVLWFRVFVTECSLIITNRHLPTIVNMKSVIFQKFQYIYLSFICDLTNVF